MGGLGLAWALVKERNDRSYRTVAALEADTDAPCVSLLPQAPPAEVARLVRGEPSLLSSRLAGVLDALSTAEDGSVGKVMLVTSIGDGEGKSVVAHGLARLLVEVGARVLLVTDEVTPRAVAIDDALRLRDSGRREAMLAELLRAAGDGSALFSVSPTASAGWSQEHAAYDRSLAQFLTMRAGAFDAVVIDGPTLRQSRGRHALFRASNALLLVVSWAGPRGMRPRRASGRWTTSAAS